MKRFLTSILVLSCSLFCLISCDKEASEGLEGVWCVLECKIYESEDGDEVNSMAGMRHAPDGLRAINAIAPIIAESFIYIDVKKDGDNSYSVTVLKGDKNRDIKEEGWIGSMPEDNKWIAGETVTTWVVDGETISAPALSATATITSLTRKELEFEWNQPNIEKEGTISGYCLFVRIKSLPRAGDPYENSSSWWRLQ